MSKLRIGRFLKFLLEMNRDLSQNMLVTYLILLLIDTVWEESVPYHLDLNILLIVVIVSGIMNIFPQEESGNEEKKSRQTTKDYIMISIFAVMGSLIVYHKTVPIGHLSIPISAIAGLLIISLSILLLGKE